jgi:hypothetical protein
MWYSGSSSRPLDQTLDHLLGQGLAPPPNEHALAANVAIELQRFLQPVRQWDVSHSPTLRRGDVAFPLRPLDRHLASS